MKGDLISKKDLLELTGISYGQLYRWKRKNIIPEEWFIKKASFTGQETFFPKDDILERIEKITNLKDDYSLDQLADMFAPHTEKVFVEKKEDDLKFLFMDLTINIYKSFEREKTKFNFEDMVFMYILDVAMKSGNVSLEEGRSLLETLRDNYYNIKEKNYNIMFLRKYGVGICLLSPVEDKVFIETMTKIILNVNIIKCIQELKFKLQKH